MKMIMVDVGDSWRENTPRKEPLWPSAVSIQAATVEALRAKISTTTASSRVTAACTTSMNHVIVNVLRLLGV